jgi:hypothetical protein
LRGCRVLAIQIDDIFPAPILEIQAIPYITVLYWIEMDVIGMALEIQLVPNLMLPEPALPNRRFAMLA